MRFTDLKLIANGHVLEVYEYEKDVCSGFNGQGGRRKKDEEKSERSGEIRKTSSAKARNEVKRQALANFNERSKFVTLTFKENITDVQRANTYFKNFIKRLKYHLKAKQKWKTDFKYIAVIEFQDRGAVHYHMICNSPYVPFKTLLQLWRKGGDDGGVDIRDIREVDHVGAYMVKYMLKNTHDARLQGNKAYLSSKGLAKSSVIRGTIVNDILKNYGISEDTEKVFESSYSSEHHGCVRYKEYNLKRL